MALPTDTEHVRLALPEALRGAARHLREKGNFNFLNNEADIFTTDDLAEFIEHSADRLASGDDSDGKRLWLVFAPTCAWDDAGGNSRVGQNVFEMIDQLFRPR